MSVRGRTQSVATLAVAGLMVAAVTAGIAAQKASPADVAAKMSGTWNINRELSPSFAPPGARPGGPGGPGQRGGRGASFAIGGGFAPQRGRGGSGGGDAPNGPGDMTPEQVADQAAMRQIQQVAPTITVKASAETVSFADPRGEQSYTIDDKTAKLEMFGAKVNVKTKWDKQQLRQEFSTTSSKLIRTWEVDDTGHLVLKARIESMTFKTPEVKAVFDRQP